MVSEWWARSVPLAGWAKMGTGTDFKGLNRSCPRVRKKKDDTQVEGDLGIVHNSRNP